MPSPISKTSLVLIVNFLLPTVINFSPFSDAAQFLSVLRCKPILMPCDAISLCSMMHTGVDAAQHDFSPFSDTDPYRRRAMRFLSILRHRSLSTLCDFVFCSWTKIHSDGNQFPSTIRHEINSTTKIYK
ncbi:hypothetical protein ACS0TY_000707 [Phlomoides rotata]